MQLNRCPCCHSRISIEQMAQDECTTELMGLLLDNSVLSKTLAVYLGFFRSGKRDLSSDRALKLAKEVLTISDDKLRLDVAMHETIQSMRTKQDEGSFKPLTNHNYLRRVLETVTVTPQNHVLSPVKHQVNPKVTSKTGQAMIALEEFKHGQ